MRGNLVIYDNIKDFDIDEFELVLQEQLEVELDQIKFLQSEKEKIGNPESLKDIILNQIWTEFGNQLGLDITSETLVERYESSHSEDYSVVGANVMKDYKYRNTKEILQRQKDKGNLEDAYTGKKFAVNDKMNVDHVVSRKELFENYRRKQANLSVEELANKPENLQATNEALNKSKKEYSVEEWSSKREIRERNWKEQNERENNLTMESNLSDFDKKHNIDINNRRLQNKLDADDEKMRGCDDKARYAINKEIAISASKEIGTKACEDALKVMTILALFKLSKNIMNGLVRWFKAKSKTFKVFLEEMKESIKSFLLEVNDVLLKGAGTFVGSIVSEIIGPVINTFKKLSSLLKQAGGTFVESIKYLGDEANSKQPFEVKIMQVGKIIVAGISASSAIVLGEFLEKALLPYPGMQVVIPSLGTVANVVSIFMASLVSGVCGAIVINKIEKYIAERQKNNLVKQQIDKNNDVLSLQDEIVEINEVRLSQAKEKFISSIEMRHKNAQKEVWNSLSKIFDDTEEFNDDKECEDLNRRLEQLAFCKGD